MPSSSRRMRTRRGLSGAFDEIPVVWTLLILNAGMFVVLEAAGGSRSTEVLIRFGAQTNPLPAGELWRLVTAMFLHIGILHLAFNMWALWLFGPLFERLAGSGRFLALYGASGLLGGAATAVLESPPTVAAGASGAIFGLLGAFLVLGWRLRRSPQGQAWLRNALLLIGINIALGISVPSIGLLAHLGGLAGGIVVFAAEPLPALPGSAPPRGGQRPRSRMVAVATAVSVVALASTLWLAPTVPSLGL